MRLSETALYIWKGALRLGACTERYRMCVDKFRFIIRDGHSWGGGNGAAAPGDKISILDEKIWFSMLSMF
jgi:hypothetical protein